MFPARECKCAIPEQVKEGFFKNFRAQCAVVAFQTHGPGVDFVIQKKPEEDFVPESDWALPCKFEYVVCILIEEYWFDPQLYRQESLC